MKHSNSPTPLRSGGPESRVPITIIGSLPGLLRAADLDAHSLAASIGLDPQRLADPTCLVSFEQIGRFLAGAARLSGDELLGLHVGLAEGPGALDALGYLAMNTADVQGALATLARYLHHFGGTLTLTREGGVALLGYAFVAPQIEGAGLIVEGSMGLVLSLLRELCGKTWTPLQVQFSRALPGKPKAWQQAVQAPVYFGAESDQVAFSGKWLSQRIDRADPELHRILEARVAELDAQQSADFVTRVSTLIRAGFLSGDVSLEQVAGRLAMSSRTLKRRLQAESTSHSQLLERSRMEMACHLLLHSRASMTQITELLGYANSSAFSRAFSRWSGMPPRDWRARQKAEGAAVLPKPTVGLD
jgi:AraC-like DNA-binding protein